MTGDRLQAAEDHLLEMLALNIEALRHRRGWSLADVGKRAGVSSSLMKHIVHRRANPSTVELLRIANAFGVTLHDLTAQVLEQSFESPRPAPRYDAEEFSIAFGPRLRVYRKIKGISSSQLAASAGIATSTVQAIEKSSGEHGVKVMARIAAGLNVSYAELVTSVLSAVLAHARLNEAEEAVKSRELLRDVPGDGRLTIEEMHLRPGEAVDRRPLCGDSTLIVYAVEGDAHIAFEREAIVLQRGEAALLGADRPFTLRPSPRKSARLLVIARIADRAPRT